MRITSLTLATLVLAGTALAQDITSPAGFLTKEGATNHNYMLFSKAEMRWQAVDQSNLKTPVVINNVAWRRDFGAATNTAYAARTLTNFEFVMCDADYATVQEVDLDKNYKGTPTIAISPKNINTADWTNPPTSSPGPWDNALKFDRPYVYTGVDAFLWEVRYTANTGMGTDYPFDFDYAGGSSGYNSTSGTTVGTSCKSTGQTSAISFSTTFYNHGVKFRIYRSLSYMPANSPVFISLDAQDQNLTVPGLCTTLHALPLILIDAGTSSATGSVAGAYVDNIPYVPGLSGANLWFQAWSIDFGQPGFPLALSYAKRITVPTDPTPTSVTRFYHYKTTPTGSLIKSGPWYGGIITKFGP